MLRESVNKQTSRHIGKVLSFLENAGIAAQIKEQVRKEMWFMHDDILEIVCPEQANNGGNQ